jgi:precorrin-3B synthase
MRAETLRQLGPLRLTPWRMVLAEGPLPADPALITDPADPLLRVVACPGAPACPQGQGTTRDLARGLAPRVPPGAVLHVSGCAKGCAHPAPADHVLTARAGLWDLARAARAGDPPSRAGLTPADLEDPDALRL